MTSARAWAGQAALYALFAATVGVFSGWPSYRVTPADHAQVKVSFVHHGQRIAECRARSADELAKLPPHMRAASDCPRERSPVLIEVDIDGVTVLREEARPAGLSRDGASTLYRRLDVPAGPHRIAVRLKDSAQAAGFTHQREATLTLRPAQVLVIDFVPAHGGIQLT